MKSSTTFAVGALLLIAVFTLSAFDCGEGGNPTPTPTAVPPEPTATATATPAPPVISDLVPPLPKVIGFAQIGDMADPLDKDVFNFQSNETTADQIVENGFQAVSLFPHERVMSDDIGAVICNPGIKLLLIRPLARVSLDYYNCAGEEYGSEVWENADFGQITYDLLKKYGNLSCRDGEPLDIILQNWEADWQAKGAACRDATPLPSREYRAMHMYETWQTGMEWARSQFPDAQLRVFFGLVVNHRLDDKYPWTVTRDMIPNMEHKPDLIGLSYYGDQGDETPQQAVDTVRLHTGYPLSRMYWSEYGVSEKYKGRQAEIFETVIPQMAVTGLRPMIIWDWKQYLPGRFKDDGSRGEGWFGMWEVDPEGTGDPTWQSFTGCWTSGLEYLSRARLSYEGHPLPPVDPPDCEAPPTPTPIPPTPTLTPIPPTATPTVTPTPPEDPCADCPPPGTIGCTINWPACVACWEACGQPIATPTPTQIPPVISPTQTPTPGGPTPTPVPGDCSDCPPPDSLQCTLFYPACAACWEACGHPLPTPTPAATKTPTPTPTPSGDPSNPLFTTNAEGHPVMCDWLFTNPGTGTVLEKHQALCTEFHLAFPEPGDWIVQVTTQYAHGVLPGINEDENGNRWGDLDGDGLYEYEHTQILHVDPAPVLPIIL